MGGDGSLKKREGQGKGTESSDRRSKVGKRVIIEGERSVFEFTLSKRVIASIEASGGSADGFKVIDCGDSVDVVAVGKLYDSDYTGILWIAGDGFHSGLKRLNSKFVVYTPPCSTKFLKKELDEMSTKEFRSRLKMKPIDIFFDELGKAGIPCEDYRRAMVETFKLVKDEDYDDYDEDTGDEAEPDLG